MLEAIADQDPFSEYVFVVAVVFKVDLSKMSITENELHHDASFFKQNILETRTVVPGC